MGYSMWAQQKSEGAEQIKWVPTQKCAFLLTASHTITDSSVIMMTISDYILYTDGLFRDCFICKNSAILVTYCKPCPGRLASNRTILYSLQKIIHVTREKNTGLSANTAKQETNIAIYILDFALCRVLGWMAILGTEHGRVTWHCTWCTTRRKVRGNTGNGKSAQCKVR